MTRPTSRVVKLALATLPTIAPSGFCVAASTLMLLLRPMARMLASWRMGSLRRASSANSSMTSTMRSPRLRWRTRRSLMSCSLAIASSASGRLAARMSVCGREAKGTRSSFFRSTRTNRRSVGLVLAVSDHSMVASRTLLPLPVVPAISECGVAARSTISSLVEPSNANVCPQSMVCGRMRSTGLGIAGCG